MDARQDHRDRAIFGRGRDQMPSSQSIDWYSEGQSREVQVAGLRVTVRLVGRKGRHARISITAPLGTVFSDGGGLTN